MNVRRFKHVVTFNMDEYVGLPKDHPESYHVPGILFAQYTVYACLLPVQLLTTMFLVQLIFLLLK